MDDNIRIPKEGLCVSPPYPDREEVKELFDEATLTGDYVLHPGAFVIGQIKETIKLSDGIVGSIQNRNSVIRLGINVGLSGYINPGYQGKLPIAIQNIGAFDFKLTPGMRICQLVLSETQGVAKDYACRTDSKYHEEKDITLSRLSEDKEFSEYVSKFGKKADVPELARFLRERIEGKSKDFFSQLTVDQKKRLGLA